MRSLCLLTLFFLLVSCSDRKHLKSSGSPYYVTVENDCDSMVFHVLDTDVPGLPQREPSFDIFEVTGNFPKYTLSRNIVRVRIDPKYDRPQIRYAKNVYAQPQIIINVCAPSEKILRAAMSSIGPQLRKLLNSTERNAATAYLMKHHLKKEEKRIRETFNADFLLPEEFTASKQGEQFMWYSNNQAHGMLNICFYSYPAECLDTETWIEKRDSIMKQNIPGEEDGMYMSTVRNSIRQQVVKEKTGQRMIVSGLWEMVGDMMGGPFVAHAVFDSAHATMIVAEAFVYAPESKKRNKIKQLEAALYTLNIQNNGR